MLDLILVLDALKTFKASLIDDLTMLQNAQQHLLASGQLSSEAENTGITDMLEFLSDRWWCVKVLYGSIKQVNYHHRVMGRIVQFLSDSLTDKVCDCQWMISCEHSGPVLLLSEPPTLEHCPPCHHSLHKQEFNACFWS